jgi:hypothetical protein
MTRVGWRWWLLPGVAHETPRMVYEPPLTRFQRAVAELATYIGTNLVQPIRTMGFAYRDAARTFADALAIASKTKKNR